jgi:sec-independent protein translocase protein TatA
MGFLGIGPWEILLIIILALIVLGPGKLTDFAKSLGKTVRAIRKYSTDLTTAVTRELESAGKEPTQPQPNKDSKPENETTPPNNQAESVSQDNQPTKSGGASLKK